MTPNERPGLARALFEESQDALFLFDPETDRLLDANPTAQRLTGFSVADLHELEATGLFRFEGSEGRSRLKQASSHTGIFHSQEGFQLRTKQEEIWIPVNLTITRLHVKPKTLGLLSARDIREQRQAHQRLKNMEAELRRVLASIPVCVWSAVRDRANRWMFRYFSPVVTKITGRSPDYLLAEPGRWESIIYPEDRRRWQDMVTWAESNSSSQEEYRILRPDGSLRWLRDSIRTTTNSKGQPVRLDGVITDTTQQKETEEALNQEQDLLYTLMENVPDFIYFKDQESKFIRINKAFANRLHLKDPSEALGKTDFDFFTPEHADPAFADEKEVMQTGQAIVGKEEREVWPDGHETWVSTTKMPLRDQEARLIGTFGISREITQTKLAEKALSEQERRYRQVTQASLDGIIVADPKGQITLFNPAAEGMFGHRAEEVLGQSLTLLMPPAYQPRFRERFQQYLDTRQGHIIGLTVEMHGLRKDNTEFPLEVSLSVIDLDGQPQFLGTIRDLTERNRMRAMVVQTEKLASIGLLSAGIAHEINNPLAYVANNLVVLERDSRGLLSLMEAYERGAPSLEQTDPAALALVREVAERIDFPYVRGNLHRLLTQTRDGVQRVSRIVQSMRGLARTAPPEKEDASLPDLVDAALEMLRGRLQRDGITVETDFAVKRIFCVGNQLSQVFLNLVINAVQAIESKEQTQMGLIRLTSRQVGNEIRIEVTDNGGGIPPQNLSQLFDPFFTTKPVGEGTGLGLSISHGIITGHGGRLEVESREGEGTRFAIFLPQDGSRRPHASREERPSNGP